MNIIGRYHPDVASSSTEWKQVYKDKKRVLGAGKQLIFEIGTLLTQSPRNVFDPNLLHRIQECGQNFFLGHFANYYFFSEEESFLKEKERKNLQERCKRIGDFIIPLLLEDSFFSKVISPPCPDPLIIDDLVKKDLLSSSTTTLILHNTSILLDEIFQRHDYALDIKFYQTVNYPYKDSSTNLPLTDFNTDSPVLSNMAGHIIEKEFSWNWKKLVPRFLPILKAMIPRYQYVLVGTMIDHVSVMGKDSSQNHKILWAFLADVDIDPNHLCLHWKIKSEEEIKCLIFHGADIQNLKIFLEKGGYSDEDYKKEVMKTAQSALEKREKAIAGLRSFVLQNIDSTTKRIFSDDLLQKVIFTYWTPSRKDIVNWCYK